MAELKSKWPQKLRWNPLYIDKALVILLKTATFVFVIMFT